MYNYSYRFIVLALTTGCGFQAGSGSLDAAPGDSSIDSRNQAFGTFIQVKFQSASAQPTSPLMIDHSDDIDTETSPMCDKHNDQMSTYCVVTGTDITIKSGVAFRAHGPKSLILLATGNLDLEGVIDVSSTRGGNAGAGAPTSCEGGVAAVGHSGGAGGSFAGKGGSGEDLDGAGDAEKGGVAAPTVATLPTTLRGGCPGGNGAMLLVAGGVGGSGGGAVDVIATSITMNGKIDASGAGGTGGPVTLQSGGGGGGAGGMIVLDAPTITPGAADRWLFASGGGGGQGGTGMNGGIGPGANGMDPVDPINTVLGGKDTSVAGGSGGDGTAGSTKDGNPGGGSHAVGDGGGGGGGGGTGYIRSIAIDGAEFAPEPTPP